MQKKNRKRDSLGVKKISNFLSQVLSQVRPVSKCNDCDNHNVSDSGKTNEDIPFVRDCTMVAGQRGV